MRDDATVLAEYLHCLEAVRLGGTLMAEDEAKGVSMEGRLAVARNILQAYETLVDEGSPFRTKLKQHELDIVAKARLALATPAAGGRPM